MSYTFGDFRSACESAGTVVPANAHYHNGLDIDVAWERLELATAPDFTPVIDEPIDLRQFNDNTHARAVGLMINSYNHPTYGDDDRAVLGENLSPKIAAVGCRLAEVNFLATLAGIGRNDLGISSYAGAQRRSILYEQGEASVLFQKGINEVTALALKTVGIGKKTYPPGAILVTDLPREPLYRTGGERFSVEAPLRPPNARFVRLSVFGFSPKERVGSRAPSSYHPKDLGEIGADEVYELLQFATIDSINQYLSQFKKEPTTTNFRTLQNIVRENR
jgi:hypothetical protein